MVSKSKQFRKIAIVHDILFEYGGAETVLLELLSIFPKAHVYTFIYNSNNTNIKKAFPQKIRSSFFSKIPFIHTLGKYISLLKFFSWIYFLFLDLKEYDLIISSCHSYNSKIVSGNKRTRHISYIHTPPRYLYELSNELVMSKGYLFRFLFFPLLQFMRLVDKYAAQKPDLLIANSVEVQNRIREWYGFESQVVYPPIHIPKIKPGLIEKKTSRKKYYVAHSRLVKQKGIELLVRTCTLYNLPLIVIGTGHQEDYLKKIAGKTVFFTGFLDQKKVADIYKNARALLFAAVDEDFGIIPVEAQAHGLPVVAYKSGGLKETVIQGLTGVFFEHYSPCGLIQAIKKFESHNFKSVQCRNNALKFRSKFFRDAIVKLVYAAS